MIAISLLALFIAIAAIRRILQDEDDEECADPHCDVCRYHKAHHL